MDTNGLSDPYVVVATCGVERRSKTCAKTLNPIWEEELLFPGVTLREVLDGGLSLKLWDQVRMIVRVRARACACACGCASGSRCS